MAARIELRDGETIREAIFRFRKAVYWARKRQWHKTRPGAYEKPSFRRRRRETLRLTNIRRIERGSEPSTSCMGLGGLFSRNDPFSILHPRYCDDDQASNDDGRQLEIPIDGLNVNFSGIVELRQTDEQGGEPELPSTVSH